MSGGIPNPDTDIGEIIGFGNKLLLDNEHVISQFLNANSARNTILFSNRKDGTRVRVLYEKNDFFTE